MGTSGDLEYGTVMYSVDVSPDGKRLVGSFGEIDGKQEVRVFEIEALKRGDTTPIARFDFGTAVPNSFVFSPTDAMSTAAPT